jgi:hypothetical protein
MYAGAVAKLQCGFHDVELGEGVDHVVDQKFWDQLYLVLLVERDVDLKVQQKSSTYIADSKLTDNFLENLIVCSSEKNYSVSRLM